MRAFKLCFIGWLSLSSGNLLGKACSQDALNEVASCFERLSEHRLQLKSYSSAVGSTGDKTLTDLRSYFTKRRDGHFHCVVIFYEWIPSELVINYTQDFTIIPHDIGFHLRAKQSGSPERSVDFTFEIMDESFSNLRDSLSEIIDHRSDVSACHEAQLSH